jgi:stage III sporulation protein AG
MDYLRKFFDNNNKKNLINLGLAFGVGILLIFSSSTLFKKEIPEESNYLQEEIVQTSISNKTVGNSFEEVLENRLEETLSAVDGVGDVKIMLTTSYGKEIILASNVVFDESRTKESDSEGGIRETYEMSSTDQKIIIKDSNNVDKPLILKEIEPKVEGVLIIAQGGDDIVIKDALIRATQTVLGIDSHKVQVLRMK